MAELAPYLKAVAPFAASVIVAIVLFATGDDETATAVLLTGLGAAGLAYRVPNREA